MRLYIYSTIYSSIYLKKTLKCMLYVKYLFANAKPHKFFIHTFKCIIMLSCVDKVRILFMFLWIVQLTACFTRDSDYHSTHT